MLQDLGLGVFVQRRAGKRSPLGEDEQDTEMPPAPASNSSSSVSSASEEDEDYDTDASSEIITCYVPSRPIRPPPRRARPKPHIVVLDG